MLTKMDITESTIHIITESTIHIISQSYFFEEYLIYGGVMGGDNISKSFTKNFQQNFVKISCVQNFNRTPTLLIAITVRSE